MAPRRDDNEEERQARIEAMAEAFRDRIGRANHAQASVRAAHKLAARASVLAKQSRQPRKPR